MFRGAGGFAAGGRSDLVGVGGVKRELRTLCFVF